MHGMKHWPLVSVPASLKSDSDMRERHQALVARQKLSDSRRCRAQLCLVLQLAVLRHIWKVGFKMQTHAQAVCDSHRGVQSLVCGQALHDARARRLTGVNSSLVMFT